MTAWDDALAARVARVAFFIELQFFDGTVRMCNSTSTYNWGGYDWIGLGSIGDIGAITENSGVAVDSVILSLNVVQPELLAIAAGPVENYRGYPAKIYFSPLNESFLLVDTPQLCWSGLMDTVSISVDGETGSISMKCETSAYGLKRRPYLHLNAAQQKQRHVGDTGFDQLIPLMANPVVWLSKKFQQV